MVFSGFRSVGVQHVLADLPVEQLAHDVCNLVAVMPGKSTTQRSVTRKSFFGRRNLFHCKTGDAAQFVSGNLTVAAKNNLAPIDQFREIGEKDWQSEYPVSRELLPAETQEDALSKIHYPQPHLGLESSTRN